MRKSEEVFFVALVLTLFLLLTIYYAVMAKHYCELYCRAEGMQLASYSGFSASCSCMIPPAKLTELLIHAGQSLQINISTKSSVPEWMQPEKS